MRFDELTVAVSEQRVEVLIAMRPPRPKSGWILVPVIGGTTMKPIRENSGRLLVRASLDSIWALALRTGLRRLEVFRQATCLGCGCDDGHPPSPDMGTWSWVRLDIREGLGVCSACPEHVERWDAGDRTGGRQARERNSKSGTQFKERIKPC